MLIKTFTVGQLQTNCYVVTDESSLSCAVIDPGAESGTILNYIEENKLKLKAVFLTHGHADHIGGVPAIYEATGAAVYVHARDAALPGQDVTLHYQGDDELLFYREGNTIPVGGLSFRVLETPGHTPGSVTLQCENALFTGDTLFRGSCGRTDFPGGNKRAMKASLRRLAELQGEFEVYPGHMDASSLERERRFNSFVADALEE